MIDQPPHIEAIKQTVDLIAEKAKNIPYTDYNRSPVVGVIDSIRDFLEHFCQSLSKVTAKDSYEAINILNNVSSRIDFFTETGTLDDLLELRATTKEARERISRL